MARSMYPGESRYHYEERVSVEEYNRGLDVGRELAHTQPNMSVEEIHAHVDSLPIPQSMRDFEDYFQKGYADGVFWGYRHEARI